MNKRIGLVAAGVVTAAVMAGGTAFAVSSSIPDSSGVIHGCYSTTRAGASGGTALNVIDSAQANCSKGQTALTWNQQGVPGPAGPGYVFTTGTGNPGPQVTQDGTYFVVVSAGINSESLTSTLFGDCQITPSNFNPGSPRFDPFPTWSLVVTPPTGDGPYEFSGIITVSGGASSTNPLTPAFECYGPQVTDNVPATSVTWRISPVSTSG
jgi:hypothetical protein